MFAVRRFAPWPIACIAFVVVANPATATADENFPEHARQAFAAYDQAAVLIVAGQYDKAAAALDGLARSLPLPYSTKAAAAAEKLQATVVRPKFDLRSSYQRGRQRMAAAEVCLHLHAYAAAADILDEVVRDAAIAVRDADKIDVVRRAYRYAESDPDRYREMFDHCRSIDPEIYSRRSFESDEKAAARPRHDGSLEPLDELTDELSLMGLEEFHWLRLRKLADTWTRVAAERGRALPLLSESAAGIGDFHVAYLALVRPAPDPTQAASASPAAATPPAPVATPTQPARSADQDSAAAAAVMQMLELDRPDAAANLSRELIRIGGHADTCFPAVLATAARLTETGRFEAALDLYCGLVLAPQFVSHAYGRYQAAVGAYRCCVRKGDPQPGLQWATMAVEQFHRRASGGPNDEAIRRQDAYLLSEARLRADPSDANIDAGFDVLITYGSFEGSIGPLIAAEYARRGELDALVERLDRLAEHDAAGKLPGQARFPSGRSPLDAAVVPGMRMLVELERIRSLGRWEPLWEHLCGRGRRVHEALRLSPGTTVALEDLIARQSAALLLDRSQETVRNLGRVRRFDDLKLGWKLYISAALGRPEAAANIRARFDTIAATPEANLRENYLDCLTALSALPDPQRQKLLGEIRSARYRLEKQLESDSKFRAVLPEDLKAVRRPRYLEE